MRSNSRWALGLPGDPQDTSAHVTGDWPPSVGWQREIGEVSSEVSRATKGAAMIELVPSPWYPVLDRLLRSVRDDLLLVTPFITRGAMGRVLDSLSIAQMQQLRVHVVTDLTVSHLLDGSMEPSALLDLLDCCPATVITVAPRLHAKAYVADASAAVVTSANLTEGGLRLNREYGLLLRDTGLVSQLRLDLEAYAKLGNQTSRARIEVLTAASLGLRESRDKLMRHARRALLQQFQANVRETRTEILRARAEGKTTHGIFRDAILYLLQQHGPLTTKQLHPLAQTIHPDLCDDSIDRVIAGVHFGKRWKHYVRNAQQDLKRRGLVALDHGTWRALQGERPC